MKRSLHIPKKILKCLAVLIFLGLLAYLVSNLIVCLGSKGRMRNLKDSNDGKTYECIIVLGCGVQGGQPTLLLSDRLDVAIKLYENGAAPKILMSGDHGQTDYDEVNAMRQYAIDRGVPSEDIFMDHAGFSTYETMYRAKNIFGIDSAVVVTQKYHLYRALYDAEQLGIDSVGTMATERSFARQPVWTFRETLARPKDIIWCIVKPDPTYLGETIDISGNGEVTLD